MYLGRIYARKKQLFGRTHVLRRLWLAEEERKSLLSILSQMGKFIRRQTNIGSVYFSGNDQSEANSEWEFNWPDIEKQVAHWRTIASRLEIESKKQYLSYKNNIYPEKGVRTSLLHFP